MSKARSQKKYTVRTVADFAKIPKKHLREFLEMFEATLLVDRQAKELFKATEPMQEFTWIDDGSRSIRVVLSAKEAAQ